MQPMNKFFRSPDNKISLSGFTLIEMAVVIIILGFLSVAFTQAYALRIKNMRSENTITDIQSATANIASFRGMFGRYPCPASLTASTGNVNYGREQCNNTLVIATGSCTQGICVQESPRDATVRVRVGTVPFRQMNMEEEDVIDGYGHRLMYVVTESLTDDNTFLANAGGVGIINQNGNSTITPDSSAHFMIFSAGENGSGGFNRNGVQNACDPAASEFQNCSVTCIVDPVSGATSCTVAAVAQYRAAELNESNIANLFDDVAEYFIEDDIPLWQLSAADNSAIHQKPGGAAGIGMPTTSSMNGENRVNGEILVEDDAATLTTVEGQLLSDQICEPDPVTGSRNCFPTSLLAADPATGSLTCPSGQYMIGVANGAPICNAEVIVRCPPGEYMRGVDAAGQLVCTTPPPADCLTQQFGICSTTAWISSGADGVTNFISAGASRREYYRCANGNWIFDRATGSCNCTPGVVSSTSVSCGSGYTGTATATVTQVCPAGTTTTTVDISTCTCVPATQTRNINCASGFTGTSGQEARNWTCSGNVGSWGPWTVVTPAACTCTASTQTRNISCSGGLTGTIPQIRTRSCPSGSWGAWGPNGPNTCACVPVAPETRTQPCPPGEQGNIIETRTFQCPSATWTAWAQTGSTCAPIPPQVCNWNPVGSPAGPAAAVGLGPSVTSICTCGATGRCHQRLGINNNLNYTSCICD